MTNEQARSGAELFFGELAEHTENILLDLSDSDDYWKHLISNGEMSELEEYEETVYRAILHELAFMISARALGRDS